MQTHPTASREIKPEQQLLFATDYYRTPAPPAPPANATATSKAAAASIEQHAPTQRDLVLAAIIEAGLRGATNEELVYALNMRTSSVSARRNEQIKLDLITPHGTRPGSSGRA